MQGVASSPIAGVANTGHQQDSPITALKSKVDAFESKKGFHTQGAPSSREELEGLFKSAIQLKGHADVKPIVANIARLYAMTFYNDQQEGCFAYSRVLCLYAVNNLLSAVALDFSQTLLPESYPSLKEWKTACLADAAHTQLLEKHFLDTSRDSVVTRTHGNPELQWAIASTLRWLGHSYQNCDGYGSREHDKLFDQVYGMCGDLLLDIRNDRSEAEYIELLYNTILYLYERSHPRDLDGAYKKFQEEFLPKYRSAALEARVANLFSVQYEGEGKTEKAFEMSMHAVSIYETKSYIVSPFTVANTFANQARLRMSMIEKFPMKCNDAFKEKIPKYFEVAARHIAEERTKGNENTYFSIWELNMAKWEAMNGRIGPANQIADQVIVRVSQMVGKWSAAPDILKNAMAFKLSLATKKP